MTKKRRPRKGKVVGAFGLRGDGTKIAMCAKCLWPVSTHPRGNCKTPVGPDGKEAG